MPSETKKKKKEEDGTEREEEVTSGKGRSQCKLHVVSINRRLAISWCRWVSVGKIGLGRNGVGAGCEHQLLTCKEAERLVRQRKAVSAGQTVAYVGSAG